MRRRLSRVKMCAWFLVGITTDTVTWLCAEIQIAQPRVIRGRANNPQPSSPPFDNNDQPPANNPEEIMYDEYGCPINWNYQDDYCDEFCSHLDPDCGGTAQGNGSEDYSSVADSDPCDESWYFDDVCDPNCLYGDPVCHERLAASDSNDASGSQTEQVDLCEEYGLYSDGFCDDLCLYLDPDCEWLGAADLSKRIKTTLYLSTVKMSSYTVFVTLLGRDSASNQGIPLILR